MLPSEADISAAIYGAIQAYGWGYLAIITQNENILTLVSTSFSVVIFVTKELRTYELLSDELVILRQL